MSSVMGLTPGQRPGTVRQHTATVTDGQSGPLGALDDPGGPPDLQRLSRRTPQDRRQQRHRHPQPHPQLRHPARISSHRSFVLVWALDHGSFMPARVLDHRLLIPVRFPGRGWVDVGVAMVARVLLVVGVPGDQHPGQRPITGQPPTRLRIQRTHRAGLTTNGMAAAQEAVQVHGDRELRADPAGLGEPPTL